MLDSITPLVLTLDEMPNLERTFAPLAWARRIVVVDSGSTDGTREWLQRDSRVALFTRPFDAHARQWEYGLRETDIQSPWILALDADHVVTLGLLDELRALDPRSDVDGYEAPFRYLIEGRPLRASLYPPRIVLGRREAVHFAQDGHTQRLWVDGRVVRLRSAVLHDDRKPRARFLASQAAYAKAEAEKLLSDRGGRTLAGSLRRAGWITPWLVPLWYLVVRGGLFDGRIGWIYAGERATAEWVLALEILTRRLRRFTGPH
jgi:hypothetical protein